MMSALNLFQKNLFFTLHFSQNLQVQTQNGYSSTNSFLFNMFHFCNLYVKLIFFGATVETHSQIFNDYEFHFAVKKTRYVNLSKLHISSIFAIFLAFCFISATYLYYICVWNSLPPSPPSLQL